MRLIIFYSFIYLISSTSHVRASSSLDFNIYDVTAFSDAVVVCKVDSIDRGYRRGDSTMLTTVNYVTVLRSESGLAKGKLLKVLVPGGHVGDTVITIAGAPEMSKDEHVLLFLRNIEGDTYGIVDWSSGLYRLIPLSDSKLQLVTTSGAFVQTIEENHLTLVNSQIDSATSSDKPAQNDVVTRMSLDEFLSKIIEMRIDIKTKGYSGRFGDRLKVIRRIKNVKR